MTGTDIPANDLGAGTFHAIVERSGAIQRRRADATIYGRSRYADPGAQPASLCLLSADAAHATFRIVLASQDGAAIATLGPFSDEDAVAIWRSLGASSGLPLVLADEDGAVHTAAQIGRLQLGHVHLRRRVASVGRRRPRFLTRRKSASLPRRPLVYREPELAARPDGR